MLDTTLWARHELWWRNRASKYGDAYVGRIGENHVVQYQKVVKLLEQKITGYYEKALDYGCGYGRFIPTLAKHCGHIWAADILEAPLVRACVSAPNVTKVKVTNAGMKLNASMNLVVVVSVLHFLADDRLFAAAASSLRQAAAKGCRFVVIENAVDTDGHVKARTDTAIASALGLAKWGSEKVTINQREQDHWLIDGVTNG